MAIKIALITPRRRFIANGLEAERWRTLLRTFRKLLELDADVLNAVYITPHPWTAAGRETLPEDMLPVDLSRHTYRNQVVRTPHLAPWRLFLGVKAAEALFHLRPRAILRLLRGPDSRARRILRGYLAAGVRVVLAELAEFVGDAWRGAKSSSPLRQEPPKKPHPVAVKDRVHGAFRVAPPP